MKRLFGAIAAKYDMMNRIMSLSLDGLWRRRAIGAASMESPGRILDLACGTGDFTVELLRRFPGAEVTCVDLTPEMLDIARAKLARYPQVVFRVGDAQDLSDLHDGSFGLAVCGFGFRNFPDKTAALAECRRVLSMNGRLVVLELFRPQSRIMGRLVNAWIAFTSFAFANAFGKEYAYLRRSVSQTVSADGFAEMAEAAGFAVVSRKSMFPAATALVLERRDGAGQ